MLGPYTNLVGVDRYRLHTSDGGEADIYVTLEPLFDSMMINHFSPSQVLDLVVAFARAAGVDASDGDDGWSSAVEKMLHQVVNDGFAFHL